MLEIGFGEPQAGEVFTLKECEPALAMCRGQMGEARLDFKKEHQPVCLAVAAVLADETREVEVGGLNLNAEFFPGLAARRSVRRLAMGRVELSPTRTPKAKVRLLRPLHQQHAILFVEAIEQCRYLVRKGRHNHFTKRASAAILMNVEQRDWRTPAGQGRHRERAYLFHQLLPP